MNTIKVDFHVHSIFSPDSISRLSDLYEKAVKLGLGKLIITDHNTIRGAQQLHDIYPDFVIVGEEIKTTSGEILAFFVQEEIPAGLEPAEVFSRLRAQGAVISLSHPYAFDRYGWSEEEMIENLAFLDAIEFKNARCTKRMNRAAGEFAAKHNIRGTAGSDSHSLVELGRMGLALPDFQDAPGLREALKTAVPFGRESSFFVRASSRYAFFSKKLGINRSRKI